jgi:hypothetical protein
VVQRALIDSKQVSSDVRETKTTLFSADGSGGLAPSVQIAERERSANSTTVEFSKSTSLSDGAGHWTVSEVREGITRQEAGGGTTKEEQVLRPDPNGRLTTAERTVSRQSAGSPGEQNNKTETYSTNVPGQAGDEGLKLVRRETTVKGTSASGARSTMQQVEQPNPGDPGAGLQVTQEAIDIVRPGADGVAQHQSSISTSGPDGRMNTVWIDVGKSDKPAAVKVDTRPATKAKTK